ncbi:DUF881 domain-containing protein [Aestuariimicrobium sp. T2.26MG-19.2B]|uniref:DUF881 domain-containing protein n=1 Tax=Aestuariimicrobium sp. T2.26MG-19.2B TaxID=3040679 RepID=UPI002477B2C2|nr:DUF881 domain-containing protein [Aestuariimicrobium sp. T2.26MG-19.2B]CAI9404649.1 hypothetical protein AESSP_01252 [Aestuariimicrobium sp. T2.26MG-19.2B]
MSEPDELVTGHHHSVVRPAARSVGRRIVRAVRWARLRERRRRSTRLGRVATVGVIAIATLMATIGAITSHGSDLRAGRNTDLVDLVRAQADTNKNLQTQLGALRKDVDALSRADAGNPQLAAQVEQASLDAGATAVSGPAVKVTLTDAPLSVQPVGVDEDLLVVHQQDIQLVVNLFWAAGAEAMTIQGQRVISTTGVKCVGNSVVLHGIPYAPPYEIVAIGDPGQLIIALDTSDGVRIYKQYADRYQLGWKQADVGRVTMPAYTGSTTLSHAKPIP